MLSFGVKELLVNAVPLGWLGLEQQKLDAKSGNRGKDAREKEKKTQEERKRMNVNTDVHGSETPLLARSSSVNQKCIKSVSKSCVLNPF